MSGAASRNAPGLFPPTRWSVVLEARNDRSPESAAAMEAICRAYWYPLYAYVRRCGRPPHDAEDLTQEFFRRLLEKRWLDSADQGKGRLRTFLVVALKNFLRNEWRRASAKRRGGDHAAVPFDTALAETRYAADAHPLAPEEAFDRQWALALLDRTVMRLKQEFETSRKAHEFEILKSCLMAERGAIDYAETAARLGSTEGAARVAVHRLRKRFRELFRQEITQTLSEDADVDVEVRHLAAALARQP